MVDIFLRVASFVYYYLAGGTNMRPDPRILVAKAVTLVVVFLLSGPLLAAEPTIQELCGPAPAFQSTSEINEQTKGEIQGKAQALSKFLGSGDIGGKVEQDRRNIYQSADKIAAAQQDAYYLYTVCAAIMQDKTVSLSDKLRALREARRPFSSEPLPSPGGQLGPGAPSSEYLRHPDTALMQQKTVSGDGSMIGVHDIGLYGCALNGSTIDCYLTESRRAPGSRDWRIDNLFGPETKLVDDAHLSHDLARAAWIDGRGGQHATMNVGQNDPVWFVLQFKGADPDISKVRIDFKTFTGGHLDGEIVK
jgi:hypothetical protein